MAEDYLTEDVRDLMARLASTLQSDRRQNSVSNNVHPKLRHAHQQSLDAELPSRRTVSSKEFVDTTYRRLQGYAQKAEQAKLAAKAEELAEVERQLAAGLKPSASAEQIPMSSRFQKVLVEQQQKRKELCERVISEREQKLSRDLTFSPSITSKVSRDKMTPEEFFAYNQKWLRDAKESRDAKRLKELQKEREIFTHQPELNPVSRKLTSKPQYRAPVQDRFSECSQRRSEKLEALRKKLQPTFQPVITPKSERLARKANTPPAFARLYTPKRKPRPEALDMEELDAREWAANAPTVFFNLDV